MPQGSFHGAESLHLQPAKNIAGTTVPADKAIEDYHKHHGDPSKAIEEFDQPSDEVSLDELISKYHDKYH
ncbi:MAG TPA: hypothetical protein PLR08_02030 [bacterium]|nr:hypothetical protein [bacterium]